MIVIEYIHQESVRGLKMYIIGDLIIDRYTYVRATRLSPEAPVPIVQLTDKEVYTLGGAGLAASYAKKHGIEFSFATKYNKLGRKLVFRNNLAGETSRHSSYEEKLKDLTKHRYIDIGTGYHLLRVDNDSFDCYGPIDNLLERVKTGMEFDDHPHKILVLLDYRKGIFSDEKQCQELIDWAHREGLFIYVDTRREDLQRFFGADIIKLNESEFQSACKKYEVKTAFGLRDKWSRRCF
jgi:D-beta-D-heptose 7-phosphate kinase/D-beta-D-heptose 1-phosphate adenosyltransferase